MSGGRIPTDPVTGRLLGPGPNPSGLCQCGCGERTPIAERGHRRTGNIKGTPRRYVSGHVGRKREEWGKAKRVRPHGYIQILDPEHPNADQYGYVLEHVAVVAKAMGKAVPPGVQVHHVNEDRGDNRNRNLVACQDHAYHMLLHVRQRALDASGHADWIRCSYCKTYDDPARMISYNGRAPYHRYCDRTYENARRRRVRAERRAAS